MAMSTARFNFIQPGLEPAEMSERYRAALDMVSLMDANGFAMISLEEHHGADNGWSPSPLATAGLIFGRTQNVGVTVSALLVPLHDPLRLAEDIAVLDLASGGRLVIVAGLGYRPEEYAAHRKDWSRRGQLLDESLDAMLKAWTGEPFDYGGTTVRVTPRPLTQPHPLVLVGGTSKVAARRAARFGLPFFPAANLPELEAYYYERCTAEGTQGFCMMPAARTTLLFVAEDPDKAWAEIGHHLLHEAQTYFGMADTGHSIRRALPRHHHRRAAQRGHLPDRHSLGVPGRGRGSGRIGVDGHPPALRRDAHRARVGVRAALR